MYRVLVGLHKEIKVSFLPVGHTKFLPDWCFGLFKQQFRRMNIDCLDDIVQAVNTLVTPNVAQLVGSQMGETIVPTFNWSDHFNTNTQLKWHLKALRKYNFSSHHFPVQVKVKNDCDGTERTIDLCKEPSWQPTATKLLDSIILPGLSLEHQWYLFEKVREYCPDQCKDLVCPRPAQTS